MKIHNPTSNIIYSYVYYNVSFYSTEVIEEIN
ncbi:MAG: hypothetical protein C5S41_02285, partial [Candidatus Methanomarinus sp.]